MRMLNVQIVLVMRAVFALRVVLAVLAALAVRKMPANQ